MRAFRDTLKPSKKTLNEELFTSESLKLSPEEVSSIRVKAKGEKSLLDTKKVVRKRIEFSYPPNVWEFNFLSFLGDKARKWIVRNVTFMRRWNKNYLRTTKYRWYLLVPAILWAQLKKLSNLYFILIMLLNFIPGVSPTPPVTSTLPVIFIFGVNLAKDLAEEMIRFVGDIKANTVVIRRMDHLKRKNVSETDMTENIPVEEMFTNCYTCNLEPGDIILLKNDAEIPVDMCVLHTSRSDGSCFVKTANLDGESNLKPKQALRLEKSFKEVVQTDFKINVCKNSEDLDEFEGSINTHAATIDNVLLKGCKLENTDEVLGLVMFVGGQTKISLNMKKSRRKIGMMDKGLNVIVFILFLIQQICIFTFIGISYYSYFNVTENMWFLERVKIQISVVVAPILGLGLPPNGEQFVWVDESYSGFGFVFWVTSWMTFFILFEIMIPMSLFVTMEIVKVVQARRIYLNNRNNIIDNGDTGSVKVNTMDLSWDLGFVDIVFSDKTGTLTQNLMQFRRAFCAGIEFDDRKCAIFDKIFEDSRTSESQKELLKHFLIDVMLCNSVDRKKDPNTDELVYTGDDADEKALVRDLACGNELEMLYRDSGSCKLSVFGVKKNYKTLEVVPFNSDRKRMSVIVEDEENGKIYVYIKGADSMILERLSKEKSNDPTPIFDATLNFSRQGLRTLVFAYKEVSREDWDSFKKDYNNAKLSTLNKAEEMEDVIKEHKMEDGFTLLGVTGIKDDLQDGVPESLAFLNKAGVNLWVLTGDKVETAVSIAKSANVIEEGDEIVRITKSEYCKTDDKQEQLATLKKMFELILPRVDEKYDEKVPNKFVMFIQRTFRETMNSLKYALGLPKQSLFVKKKGSRLCLIVDCHSLRDILMYYSTPFTKLIRNCGAVVCARVTPAQKADVTRLVQNRLSMRGLAIGDGANDVPMIQSANIGIGILGVESTQAARASDFSIPKFKYLIDLMSVEGRHNYIRSADTILVSFYKNVILAFINVIYVFFNGVTGKLITDAWIFKMYNTIFYAFPPAAFGFLEIDLHADILKKEPELYKSLKRNPFFNVWRIMYMILSGVLHVSICFAITYFSSSGGNTLGVSGNGIFVYGNVITCSFMTSGFLVYALEVKTWNPYSLIFILGGYILFVGWLFITSLFPVFAGVGSNYMVPQMAAIEPKFYQLVLISVCLCIIPHFIIKYVKQTYFPDDWQRIKKKMNKLKKRTRKNRNKISSIDMELNPISNLE